MLRNLHKLFSKILDFLFPKEEIELLIEKMSIKDLLKYSKPTCTEATKDIKIYSIFSYKDLFIKKLIEIVKYKGNKKIINICGEILYGEISNQLSVISCQKEKKKIILIPIPSSKKRRREKGFNQCELLCEAILENNPNLFDYQKNILIKTKHRISQTKLNKKERLKNLIGSMTVSCPELIIEKEIILIDDVWTTGATIKEAQKVLREANVKSIKIYTLAH